MLYWCVVVGDLLQWQTVDYISSNQSKSKRRKKVLEIHKWVLQTYLSSPLHVLKRWSLTLLRPRCLLCQTVLVSLPGSPTQQASFLQLYNMQICMLYMSLPWSAFPVAKQPLPAFGRECGACPGSLFLVSPGSEPLSSSRACPCAVDCLSHNSAVVGKGTKYKSLGCHYQSYFGV